MNALQQFIQDCNNSVLFKDIINDKNVEVIMIWVTGSTILGGTDEKSDYDLCVLIKDRPPAQNEFYNIYARFAPYSAQYKPQQKKVQWIYNTVEEITTSHPVSPLDNIGWAQFRYITDDFIIYRNPKYSDFINKLIQDKYLISDNALFSFVNSILRDLEAFKSTNLRDIATVYSSMPNKCLGHLYWTACVLLKESFDLSFMMRVKRWPYSLLENDDKNKLINLIDRLEIYIKNTLAPNLTVLIAKENNSAN